MDPINTLSQRLDRLEREKRKLRVLGGVLLLGLACLLLVGQAPSQDRMVVANSFVLLGQDGKPRAELAMSSSGYPGLRFYDAKGHYSSELGLDSKSNPFLAFSGGEHIGSVRLHLQEDGSPRLTLRDRYHRASISLQAGPGSSIHRKTSHWEGQVTAGSPSLEITDSMGRLGLVLGTYYLEPAKTSAPVPAGTVVPITTFTYGPSSLTFFDRAGDETLQMSGYGYPNITITDKEGETSAIFGTYPERTRPGHLSRTSRAPLSLVFRGENREVLWKAP